jgi:peptide-methionine (S)-S-oxide reductase
VEEETMATETITLAGGCFWCVEAVYKDLRGVESAVSGYIGGHVPNPTYEAVCTGQTGHAEAVQITYDPRQVSPRDILRIFFTTHDPTTLNRQGPDRGTQYRSAIFVRNPAEKKLAEDVIAEIAAAKIWPGRIVTTLEPFTVFYPAEEYHQNYFERYEKASPLERMKMNSGYCQVIIAPKVAKFRKQYRDKLRR